MYCGTPAAWTRKTSGGLPAAYMAYSRVRSFGTISILSLVASSRVFLSLSLNSFGSVITTTLPDPDLGVAVCWQAAKTGAAAAAAATAPAPFRSSRRVARRVIGPLLPGTFHGRQGLM